MAGERTGAALRAPVRIARSDEGVLYLSDTDAGAVFGYIDGRRVLELGGIEAPLGLAVHGERLYVGSYGLGRVEIYGIPEPQLVATLPDVGFPVDIALSPAGDRIYVADASAHEVAVFSELGTRIGSIGSPGSGDGELRFPSSVAVDSEHVYVGDQGNHRVQVYDAAGAWVRSLGGPVPDAPLHLDELGGTFVRVQALAHSGDRLLVLDSAQGRVQILGLDGAYLGAVPVRGPGCGPCVPVPLDLEVGPDGTLFLTDFLGGAWVEVPMDPDGPW